MPTARIGVIGGTGEYPSLLSLPQGERRDVRRVK